MGSDLAARILLARWCARKAFFPLLLGGFIVAAMCSSSSTMTPRRMDGYEATTQLTDRCSQSQKDPPSGV